MNEERVNEKADEHSSGEIRVVYRPAPFHRRVLAYAVDFLILALLFLALFSLERTIVGSVPPYQKERQVIAEREAASGLYLRKDDASVVTLRESVSSDSSLTGTEKREKLESGIDFYLTYVKENSSQINYENACYLYDSYRLSGDFTYLGQPYFIERDGTVSANPNCRVKDIDVVEDVYLPFLEEKLEPTLVVYFQDVYSAQRYLSLVLLFGLIPSAFLASSLLTFLVPPLFLKRGRKSVGKFVFRIGQVDEATMLNVSKGKWLAEEAIWNLAVLLLSLFTLGVPLLISFSLMAFSKKKQDFACYMLGIREVSTEQNRIYESLAEALTENEKNARSAASFVSLNRLDS